MIRDIEEYLNDEQIARCQDVFIFEEDEYIPCAYIENGQLKIEIIKNCFSDDFDVEVITYEPDLTSEEGKLKLHYILTGEGGDELC